MQKKQHKRGSILQPSHNLIGWTILLLGVLFWVTPLSIWPLVKPPLAYIQHSSRPNHLANNPELLKLAFKFGAKILGESFFNLQLTQTLWCGRRKFLPEFKTIKRCILGREVDAMATDSSNQANWLVLKKRQNVNKLHLSVWTWSTLLITAQYWSTLLNTFQHCSILLNTSQHFSTLLNTAQHCSTLLNTAQHCSTLKGLT